MAELPYHLFSSNAPPTPHLFNLIIEKWVTPDNVNDYDFPPILLGLEGLRDDMARGSPEAINHWKLALRKLIRIGADINKVYYYEWDHMTLPRVIMSMTDHPLDSKALGDEWIDVLRGAGVNVSQYLSMELGLQDISFGNFEARFEAWDGPRLRKISVGGRPEISLDWYIAPEGEAFDSLYEFRYFGPGLRYHGGLEPATWPYSHPFWHAYADRVERGWATEVQIRVVKLLEDRLERRQYKKAMKLARIQGLHKGPKIPGSWID